LASQEQGGLINTDLLITQLELLGYSLLKYVLGDSCE